MTQLTERLRQFRDDRGWRHHHSLRNLAIALNVEASELLELIQWVDDDQMPAWIAEKQHRLAVTDEIADTFIYLTYLVDQLGIDLEAAVLSKIERNDSRFSIPSEPVDGTKEQEVQA